VTEGRTSFRWSVLAFLAVTALAVFAVTALLVLLDPRSQEWWGDRLSELGTFVRALFAPLLDRG